MKNASFQSLSSPMTLRQRVRAVRGFFNNERHSTILHTAVVQLIGFAVSAVIGVIDLLINCGCKAF